MDITDVSDMRLDALERAALFNPESVPNMRLEVDAALGGAEQAAAVRGAVGESAHHLAAAADQLMLEQIDEQALENLLDSPDADRAAGRMEDARLDLLSE